MSPYGKDGQDPGTYGSLDMDKESKDKDVLEPGHSVFFSKGFVLDTTTYICQHILLVMFNTKVI